MKKRKIFIHFVIFRVSIAKRKNNEKLQKKITPYRSTG